MLDSSEWCATWEGGGLNRQGGEAPGGIAVIETVAGAKRLKLDTEANKRALHAGDIVRVTLELRKAFTTMRVSVRTGDKEHVLCVFTSRSQRAKGNVVPWDIKSGVVLCPVVQLCDSGDAVRLLGTEQAPPPTCSIGHFELLRVATDCHGAEAEPPTNRKDLIYALQDALVEAAVAPHMAADQRRRALSTLSHLAVQSGSLFVVLRTIQATMTCPPEWFADCLAPLLAALAVPALHNVASPAERMLALLSCVVDRATEASERHLHVGTGAGVKASPVTGVSAVALEEPWCIEAGGHEVYLVLDGLLRTALFHLEAAGDDAAAEYAGAVGLLEAPVETWGEQQWCHVNADGVAVDEAAPANHVAYWVQQGYWGPDTLVRPEGFPVAATAAIGKEGGAQFATVWLQRMASMRQYSTGNLEKVVALLLRIVQCNFEHLQR